MFLWANHPIILNIILFVIIKGKAKDTPVRSSEARKSKDKSKQSKENSKKSKKSKKSKHKRNSKRSKEMPFQSKERQGDPYVKPDEEKNEYEKLLELEWESMRRKTRSKNPLPLLHMPRFAP